MTGDNNVGYTAWLGHRKATLGIQSTVVACVAVGDSPGVVGRHRLELGIDQELERQVDNRSEEVGQDDLLVEHIQVERRRR